MLLTVYLAAHQLKYTDFAKILGFSPGHIRNVVHGHAHPSENLLELISIATDGLVQDREEIVIPSKKRKKKKEKKRASLRPKKILCQHITIFRFFYATDFS